MGKSSTFLVEDEEEQEQDEGNSTNGAPFW
jgi:hypothetical protein